MEDLKAHRLRQTGAVHHLAGQDLASAVTNQMYALSGCAPEVTSDPFALLEILWHSVVTAVTTCGDAGAPIGLTANSFASVSLDPPLVVWSTNLKAPGLGAFSRHSALVINIMCEGSKDLALRFARQSGDKFGGANWQSRFQGVPVLGAAAAVIQSRTEARIPGGDHEFYIRRVLDFHRTDRPPPAMPPT